MGFVSSFALGSGLALAACGGSSPANAPTPGNAPPVAQRSAVIARLDVKLAADPNRALCDQLAKSYEAGNREAMVPFFDAHAFVERIVRYRPLPPSVAAKLRDGAERYDKFSRFLSPPQSKFLCLGTRSFLGAPHIAIRQWTPDRHDYVLMRIGKDPKRPIIDWLVVSGGAYHSEAQALAFDPSLEAAMDTVGTMFQKSYDGDFQGIIAIYRSLSPELQAQPPNFVHFINAVYTTENNGSPLYAEATAKLVEVFKGRDVAIAYWQLFDGIRRHDAALTASSRATLLEALDDYELLGGEPN